MQRSQAHLRGERLEKRIQHWRAVIVSACEQCGRAMLPALQPPLPYPDWVTRIAGNGLRLMLQPTSTQTLAGLTRPTDDITLLVGPEGGLNPDEQTLATANGFTGIMLGPRILRTETAALAALAGMHTLWGDFT
jgi:16S rRNA (uracil1498-N3)-methyltransferase